MATEAPTDSRPQEQTNVCTECEACLEACPSGALREGSFEGLQCRSFRKAKGEYTPYGPQRVLRYCETCADVCPIGPSPAGRT